MRFRWDGAKERTNRAKHGIGIDAACEMFRSGRDYLEIYDEDHSLDEDRFIAVGLARGEVIVVVFTEPAEAVVRIVSARRASRQETVEFHTHLRGGDE